MDNVYVRQDPAGNIKMDKEKSTEKIDAAVATVMALDRAIRNQGSEGSVYDGRGILFFKKKPLRQMERFERALSCLCIGIRTAFFF